MILKEILSVQLKVSLIDLRMRYKVEHKKRNSISTSSCVLFLIYYIITILNINDNFFQLMIFQRNPKTFSRIVQKLSKDQTNVSKHFLKISKDYQISLKITEDFQLKSNDVSIIQQHV